MKNQLKLKICAFTLAEVLITLGIIGIIAALTIPALINSTQDAEFKNSWKENYSIISQASKLMAQDNGNSLKGLFTNDAAVANAYTNYLKIAQTCSPPNTLTCIKSMSSVGWATSFTSLTLNNGSAVLLTATSSWAGATNCTDNGRGNPLGKTYCIEFWLDVNGNKGPNINGKDLLGGVVLDDGSLIPYGAPGFTSTSMQCPTGSLCNSYLYLMNN